MMRKFTVLAALIAANPAFAASGPFFSPANTDFVVTVAFICFIGVLVYFGVPAMLTGMLDKRSEGIQKDLNDARALHEEAKTILASYERKQREVQEQADRIVAQAKEEANIAAAQAREDLKASIARRVRAAEEQIASAEAHAVKEVRDSAISIAIKAANQVMAAQMTATEANKMIDDSIKEIDAKLH